MSSLNGKFPGSKTAKITPISTEIGEESPPRDLFPEIPSKTLRLAKADDLNLLKERNRQLVSQLKDRNAELFWRNERLITSERNYRRLFEAAKDGILILDVVTGRIAEANPFIANLLGISQEKMRGKTVGELSPFKDLESNQLMLGKLQRQGFVRYEDLPLEAADGRKIAVEFVCNSYEVGDKEVIQCNIRDITERKKAEQQFKLLSTCVARLNDVVVICEADSLDETGPRVVFVNDAFERITGYSSAEVLGRNPRFLQGEKTDRQVVAEIRQAVERRQPIRRQIVNYKKDGTEYWMDIDIVPIFGSAGQCTHFAAIERDITERKIAEEKNSEQAALLDEAQDAIFVRDLDHCMTYWNKGAERVYGWTLEETLGRNICDLIYPNPEKLAAINALILSEGAWHGELNNYTKDKREITVEARFTLIRSKEGRPKSILAIVTDTTEKKKMEIQFMRAQRMESIGTLAGGIAHDLNNILAPIMMSIELLKRISKDSKTTKILKTIEVSARRGADIVRQVLSFSRGMEGERIEVQATHLLRDLELIIEDTFPKDIRLRFIIPSDIWTMVGDPTQVHQIILNLCVNARDAMPEGGSLIIAVENSVLDAQYVAMNPQAKAGRYVQISVSDSGTGMPPELIERIFEPFFTTKGINKGTGLGLSTVMAIVKSHGGIVNVYSDLGKGTTFKISLPATESTSEKDDELLQLANLPKGSGETILVIDDEASILSITRETLETFGYEVVTAGNGADAVGIYAQRRDEIAVVLTDMAMPIMDGATTVHALRRINPAVKIIAASGLDTDGGMAKGMKGNVKRFMTKPYTAETLLRTLRMVLEEA